MGYCFVTPPEDWAKVPAPQPPIDRKKPSPFPGAALFLLGALVLLAWFVALLAVYAAK